MSGKTREQQLDELLDKQAIYELIMAYCNAADRHDHVKMRTLYHEDAIDDHGQHHGQQDVGYRKFNRPFLRVWRVGSGRASAALGTDRAQIGGSCVGFRHRGATQRLSA